MLKPLRKLHVEGAGKEAFQHKTNPIIVTNPSGHSTYVNELEDKKKILATYTPENTYLFVWLGKWSSDVFEIREKNIAELLA
jgi:hypothetical protein